MSANAASESSSASMPASSLVRVTAKVVSLVAISLSVYQLYTAGITAMTALVQRSIHLAAILTLTFLITPAHKSLSKERFNFWVVLDWCLAAIAIACTVYICTNLTAIFERQGDWLPADRLVSIAGTLLVLEACRRVIGWAMTAICVLVVLYAFFGPYMPELIIHKGYSLERITTTLFLTTEGIFGLPIGVAATFVYVFVLFGAFLESTGGGNFFIEMAHALTGRWMLGRRPGHSNALGIATFAGTQTRQILGSLEKGARNAVMVSVACAAAGIIVGMVTLTGMGLKFSSLVLELSFGIKALAILLIGAASLVLGMGLPVTASYIVLATLAGPALLDMGVPLLVSHMIVF